MVAVDPGDRRGVPQRVQQRPRVRDAQRRTRTPSGSRCSATAGSTPCRSKRSWSATWSCWRWATRSPPTAGSLKATELYVDQSLMTGESRAGPQAAAAAGRRPPTAPTSPAACTAARRSWTASAQMVVTEVGDDTMLGQIARRLSADDDEEDDAGREPAPSETRVKQQADHLQGADAAPGEARRPRRADQQGRLRRGGRDLPGPARSAGCRRRRSLLAAADDGRAGRSRVVGDAARATSCTWSSSSSWRCPRGCR